MRFKDVSKPFWKLVPNLKSCTFAQAGDSDYEESDDLFVGPTGSPTAQENGDTPEGPQLDITTYGDANLLAEPQKVRMKQLRITLTACNRLNIDYITVSLIFVFSLLGCNLLLCCRLSLE